MQGKNITTKTQDSNSTLVSKNITINGRRTSVRLEPEMWLAIKEIAIREKCTIHDICGLVHDNKKENTSLTAAIRVFLMLYYRSATTEEGHIRAGHGDFQAMLLRANKKQEDKSHKNVNEQVGTYQNKGYAATNTTNYQSKFVAPYSRSLMGSDDKAAN